MTQKTFPHIISRIVTHVTVFYNHKFLASSLLLLFSVTCFSQNCLPEGIQFKSQSQVDSFRILYPGCTIIGGNVKFSVGGHFTSFDSLDHIQIIEGNLELRGAITSLDTIRAFRSLKAVNGDLFLSYLFNVEAIIGFDSILHIGGHLALTNLNELNIMDAFENLESIGENLELEYLNLSGSYHFFPRLRHTGGRINIEAGEINTITGFDSLIYIGDDLRFWEVTGLTTMDAFANLERIDGGLNIVRILDAGHFNGFPKLRIVKGDVAVLSFLDSLSGFGLLDTIGGSFELLQNDSLSEMDAFQKVRYVGDNVRIEQNPLLKTFTGLNLLDSIYDDLIIKENASLDTLATFEKLTWIADVCYIQQNQNLRNLNFLHSLISADDLVVQYNAGLLSLSGLEKIESIGNDVLVKYNSDLLSLTGLQNLRRIPRDIMIEGNHRLHDLEGLEGLRFVGHFMEITQNDSLVSLEGIDHLDSVKVVLLIEKNPLLVDFSALTVPRYIQYFRLIDNHGLLEFPYMGSFNGYEIKIKNNDRLTTLSCEPGIKNLTNTYIEENDSLSSLDLPVQSIAFLRIAGNHSLKNLKGLDSLRYVWKMEIINNNNLVSLEGLASLESVPNIFEITNNLSFVDFTGINQTSPIRFSIFIVDSNPSLQSFNGLDRLKKIDWLMLTDNPLIKNLEGLSGLDTLTIIEAEGNTSLVNFKGIPKVKKSGTIRATANPALKDLTGLENLKTIFWLVIEQNDSLSSLKGLEALYMIGTQLRLIGNPLLQDISSIRNVIISSGNESLLEIRHCPLLSECAIESICLHFINSNHQTIDSNAIGCNSVMEVEAQCLTSNKEIPFESIVIHPNPVEQELFLGDDTIINTNTTYSLYDCMGRLIKEDKWHSSLQLDGLPVGIYTLLIKTDHELRQGRFMKK